MIAIGKTILIITKRFPLFLSLSSSVNAYISRCSLAKIHHEFIDVRMFRLLTHSNDTVVNDHLYVENNNVLQVYNEMVISMMLGDRNDEMEMREMGAMLEMLRIHDEHEYSSANSKNSVAPVQEEEEVAELVTVPQNLSFYTMVYKMMIETRKKTKNDEEEREEKDASDC